MTASHTRRAGTRVQSGLPRQASSIDPLREAREIVLELRKLPCADDRNYRYPAVAKPRQQHLRHAAASLIGHTLTQMNIQLANVISDLSGLTGQTIVRAILAGERDSKKLAELSHPQIRATREEIARSLEGNWRPELLFLLKQEMEIDR